MNCVKELRKLVYQTLFFSLNWIYSASFFDDFETFSELGKTLNMKGILLFSLSFLFFSQESMSGLLLENNSKKGFIFYVTPFQHLSRENNAKTIEWLVEELISFDVSTFFETKVRLSHFFSSKWNFPTPQCFFFSRESWKRGEQWKWNQISQKKYRLAPRFHTLFQIRVKSTKISLHSLSSLKLLSPKAFLKWWYLTHSHHHLSKLSSYIKGAICLRIRVVCRKGVYNDDVHIELESA